MPLASRLAWQRVNMGHRRFATRAARHHCTHVARAGPRQNRHETIMQKGTKKPREKHLATHLSVQPTCCQAADSRLPVGLRVVGHGCSTRLTVLFLRVRKIAIPDLYACAGCLGPRKDHQYCRFRFGWHSGILDPILALVSF